MRHPEQAPKLLHMSTRSSLGLIYLMQGLQQLGYDPEPVLQKHGLSLARLDPTSRIERARELRIYADLVDSRIDPLMGLKLGRFYGLAGYGPLVMLLMTCATVHDALQTSVRYQELTYLFSRLRLEPGEHMSALVLSPMTMPPKAMRFRIDGETSGAFKMMQDMQASMGLQFQPERVDMPYPRPAEAAAYEAHFGCPVRFGESDVRFWMRNSVLHTRLPSADANAHAMYRALCDQQLHKQNASSGERLIDRVQSHLNLFTHQLPNAEEVAQALGMSVRSLRRQLSEDGHNFRDVLAQSLYARAQQLLKDTALSIEEVAQQLGYAESAAFIHAFKRWSGQSPKAYRQTRAAPASSSAHQAPS